MNSPLGCPECNSHKSDSAFGFDRKKRADSGSTSQRRPRRHEPRAPITHKRCAECRELKPVEAEAEVQEMIDGQRGKCWICRTRPAEHVDHDHATGMVRAILCFTCNAGLGNFGEDIERMESAISYLKIFQAAARAQARRTA